MKVAVLLLWIALVAVCFLGARQAEVLRHQDRCLAIVHTVLDPHTPAPMKANIAAELDQEDCP